MEHRWGKRIKVDFPIRVSAHRFAVRHGRILNLSTSGAFIEADCELRVLSRIKVAIVSTHWSKHEVQEIPAYVTRKYKHAVGVEWCEFAPLQITALLQSINKSKDFPPAATSNDWLIGALRKHGT